MADIRKYLEQIRRAVYGREVRESIATAIELINGEQNNLGGIFDQLIINAGNSNAEVVAARVKDNGTQFNTLGERLNKNDEDVANITTIVNDISQEVIDARTDKAGVVHQNLKARLDNIDEQLNTMTNVFAGMKLTSPDGTRWVLCVDNYGQLCAIKEGEI